jgi:hypothetical protein
MHILAFFISLVFATGPQPPPVNKLLQMHRLYYLPFSIEFEQGADPDDIVPMVHRGTIIRVPSAEEFQKLQRAWDTTRQDWAQHSLTSNTQIGMNESVRISHRLALHRISITRQIFDGMSISEQIQIKKLLDGKSENLRSTFTQVRFLKSLLSPSDEGRNVFFVIGAHWCQSSRAYRALVEAYLKRFPKSDLAFHAIVIDDPKKEIFESALLRSLFPHNTRYSHNTIPRFLLFRNNPRAPALIEEGEAIEWVLQNALLKHKGFLDDQVPFLFSPPRALSGQ